MCYLCPRYFTCLTTMFSLKPYNTFGVDVQGDRLVELGSVEDVVTYAKDLEDHDRRHFIIGGGSNLLFLRDLHGDIIRLTNRDLWVVRGDDDYVYIRVGAGYVWDEFVAWTTEQGLWGAELLSGIPGTVGAAPVQNIGAYGAEAADIVVEAHTVNLCEKGLQKTFKAEEMAFAYRGSLFKRSNRPYAVCNVTFRLARHIPDNRDNYTRLGLSDADITPRQVRRKVLEVRASKLPAVSELGSAGSFFKNPEVDTLHLESLRELFADIPAYPLPSGLVKIPAGWLIEQCGWKGYREGSVGVYPKHSLVLVNYGGATGGEIYNLSERIASDVHKKFGLSLEPEVEVI